MVNISIDDPAVALDQARRVLDSIPVDFSAELCGLWLWVSFPAKPDQAVRDALKAAGFRWARIKQKWYFAAAASNSRGGYSMPRIRALHGSVVLRGDSDD